MENTDNVIPMQPRSLAGASTQAPQSQSQVVMSNVHDVRQSDGYFYIGEFGGKKRYVKFDLNAFAEMEAIYGNMDEAQTKLAGGHMKDIRTVMWLGLIHDEANLDPITGEPISYNLSQYQVGSWLTPLNLKEVMAKLQSAINGSMPDEATAQALNSTAAATVTEVKEVADGENPNQ